MKKAKKFYVAWYLVDLGYGGPEEGGWYYDYGHPHVPRFGVKDYQRKPRAFRSEESAYRYRRKIILANPRVNEDRPSRSSVLSRGEFEVRVTEGKPEPFPKRRPYYC